MNATAKRRQPATPATEQEPVVAALRFSIDGDLRFLSHHDLIRMLVRALTRARWPLAYSQGFNPQPRIVLPLPRSVGMASDCEWALVRLNEARPPDALYESLAAALPAGCRLAEVVVPAPRGTPHPQRVTYAVELQEEHVAQPASSVSDVLAAENLIVERDRGPGKMPTTCDIRPNIESIALDGRVLRMELSYDGQRSARPTEVLTKLGLPASEYAHRVRRSAVTWDMVLAAGESAAPSAERNHVGKEEDHEDCQAQTQGREAHEEGGCLRRRG